MPVTDLFITTPRMMAMPTQATGTGMLQRKCLVITWQATSVSGVCLPDAGANKGYATSQTGTLAGVGSALPGTLPPQSQRYHAS